MSQQTHDSYEEWLEKSDLIRIHFYDKQLSKLHVELDKFLSALMIYCNIILKIFLIMLRNSTVKLKMSCH